MGVNDWAAGLLVALLVAVFMSIAVFAYIQHHADDRRAEACADRGGVPVEHIRVRGAEDVTVCADPGSVTLVR